MARCHDETALAAWSSNLRPDSDVAASGVGGGRTGTRRVKSIKSVGSRPARERSPGIEDDAPRAPPRPLAPPVQAATATRSLAQLRAAAEHESQLCLQRREEVEERRAQETELRAELDARQAQIQAGAALEEQLRDAVSLASEDMNVLSRDLPSVLDSHRSQLQEGLARVEALTEAARDVRQQVEALEEERKRRKHEADEARRAIDSWQQRHTEDFKQCRSIDARVMTLEGECVQMKNREVALEQRLRNEELKEEHQEVEVSQRTQELDHLRRQLMALQQQHTEASEASADRNEAAVLASQLEAERNASSASLHREQLRAKQREAVWWRDMALQLDTQLAELRATGSAAGSAVPPSNRPIDGAAAAGVPQRSSWHGSNALASMPGVTAATSSTMLIPPTACAEPPLAITTPLGSCATFPSLGSMATPFGTSAMFGLGAPQQQTLPLGLEPRAPLRRLSAADAFSRPSAW